MTEQNVHQWLVRKLAPHEDPTHSFAPRILDVLAEAITRDFNELQGVVGGSVRVEGDLSHRLLAAAERDGVSPDVVVRRALKPYLDVCDRFGGCGRLPGDGS